MKNTGDFFRKQPQTHSRGVAVYLHILVNVPPLVETFYSEDLIKEIISAFEKRTPSQIDLNTDSVVYTLGEEIARLSGGLARVKVEKNTFRVTHNVNHGGPGGRYIGKGDRMPDGSWSINIPSISTLIEGLRRHLNRLEADKVL